MSTYKRLNLVTDNAGIYALVIRGGKPAKRYRHLSAASLARCKCIVRQELNHAAN